MNKYAPPVTYGERMIELANNRAGQTGVADIQIAGGNVCASGARWMALKEGGIDEKG
jgi:hypothetical protein